MPEYAKYISRCLQLARLGAYYVAPNPMVGAVLVHGEGENARIIGEGWHQQYGGPHAEVNCFKSVKPEDEVLVRESTLYVSLEPCSHYGKTPPCADLIVSKGVQKCVVGMRDPNPLVAGQGIKRLEEHGIEVVCGVMEAECRELNKRFICLHEKKRPYVILKWAQTADGFIDIKRTSGSPLKISTPATKEIVHRMRAENMAIMVGTNTVLLDNPRLLNTHWEGRNPIRVTVDRYNRIPADARIFSDESETIVYRDRTDWPFITADLATRNIHSILVEGGTTLLNHILETGIWDEIHIEVAPEMKIGDGVPAPAIALAVTCETVDGHQLYTIYH